MPFDANGNYSLPATYKATPGQTIYAAQHNTPLEDIQAALNAVLMRDGRVAWTGNQNANGYKLTGLADGAGDQDAATMAQMQAAISASQKLCLLLASTTLQTVSSDVTFTGAVTVPAVTDFTTEVALGAKTADARYETQTGVRTECPVGTMAMWPTTVPPTGWLALNGATFDVSVYPLLGAIFPNRVLPNWSGLFPRGYDPTGIYDISGVGREIMSFQDGTIIVADVYTSINTFNDIPAGGYAPLGWEKSNTGGKHGTSFNQHPLTGLQDLAAAGVTRPKNLNCLFIVRAL